MDRLTLQKKKEVVPRNCLQKKSIKKIITFITKVQKDEGKLDVTEFTINKGLYVLA